MNKWVVAGLLVLACQPVHARRSKADPAELGAQFVGPQAPTSFPKQLLIHVTNPGYTPFHLADAIANSILMIDGKPSKRTAAFKGQPGIPAVGEWDGCLSMDDYSPPITPGKHKVSLNLGTIQSEYVQVKWDPPVNWREGNIKSREKEIQKLGETIVDGMPRDCVERWLPVKDGGQQDEDKVRYYLDPGFKVVVPYRQTYDQTGLHSVVDGNPEVYPEAHLTD